MNIQDKKLLGLNLQYCLLNESEYLSLGELGLVIAARKFLNYQI